MFFSIATSPRKIVEEKTPAEEIAILKLAPFTPNPKILFENVIVGQEITKKLIIQNPNASNNKLTITKVPPSKRNVICSWYEAIVDGYSEVILELTWIPKEEGGWRDTLSIIDNRLVKRDVPIIFNSIQQKVKKSRPTVVALPAARKHRSPKNIKKKRSPLKFAENMTPSKTKNTSKYKNSKYLESDKENSPLHVQNAQNFSYNLMENSSFFLSPTRVNLNSENITCSIRRETYAITKQIPIVVESSDDFNDSLDLPCDTTIKINKSPNNVEPDYLVQKLLSDSFAFSSTNAVTKQNPIFRFTLNDSEVKDTSCFTGQEANKNESILSKESFKPNNTYDMSPGIKNLTTDINNLSAATFTILSPECKDKFRMLDENVSTSSPILSNTLTQSQANSSYLLNFSGNNAKNALFCIQEEDTFNISSKKVNNSITGIKRKSEHSEMVFTVSPPKRAFIKPKSFTNKKSSFNSSKKLNRTENILRRSEKILNLASCSATQSTCQIDPFLIAAMYDTTTVASNCDPFISSTLYYDETTLKNQTTELKKWLNALLTPPTELQTSTESKKVDVGRLWKECIKKDLIYAPTKENVCSNYHTNHKLEILRRTAKTMFHSYEIRSVLSKVAIIIENKQLCIREDKNLHLDVGLQSQIMTLLLCYNPLWLRIGLETIYNETIQLESNSDVIGLSSFILLRFFRCPDLLPKNKHISHIKYLPTYSTGIKKFTLKKFLILVYFLDQAKTNKLIPHDPCLFCRDAPVKESKELLISFARELLSAVGDITKFLKRLGYVVTHKQNYIDEYDYAVKNLGVDLRDGIRLTKVMEIILLRNDLTNQLRGPAISRLQKIHNCKVAIDSLLQSGYSIAGDITPKDIVDGHREKTLSLLWQIIYKFQAPRFTKAATKIQLWWKCLEIVIKRRILDRPRRLKESAAIKIQQYYRSWKLMTKERAKFVTLKASTILIQKHIRLRFLMKHDRLQFLLKRQAVIIIQQKFRSLKLMKKQRNHYLKLKKAALLIQRRFRNKILTKQTRIHYLKLKEVVIKIQRYFRSKKIARVEQNNFIQLRNAATCIQRHFKAKRLMENERNHYLHIRRVVIKLQQHFRAYLQMKKCYEDYSILKYYVVYIQRRFRANITMKRIRSNYIKLKNATSVIQQQFRARRAMLKTRESFIKQRKLIVMIQQRFRANIMARKERETYLLQRKRIILIQQKFRALLIMKQERQNYLRTRKAVIALQQHFRANIAMKTIRSNYIKLKKAAFVIQQQFRARRAMLKTRENFIKQRKLIVMIQQRFRANIMARKERESYLLQRKHIILIQQKFRALLIMKQERQNYLRTRKAIVTLQQHFKANIAMKRIRSNYIKLKSAAFVFQQQFRARRAMLKARENFIEQKKLIIMVQQRFRANIMARKERETYLLQRKRIILIQQKFKALLIMKQERQNYLRTRKAIVTLQQYFRANIAMKTIRSNYIKLKNAASVIQQQFRARRAMLKTRESFIKQRKLIVMIQQRFRANIMARKERETYLLQRKRIILFQQKFRAFLIMKQKRQNYLRTRKAIVTLQQYFRANIAMKTIRSNYIKLKKAAFVIQQQFRARRAMLKTRENFIKQRKLIVMIQQRFRANIMARKERESYLLQRKHIILIQQKFRALLIMKQERQNYLRTKKAVITLQQHFRANIAKNIDRKYYLQLKKTVLFLQERFRSNMATKKLRYDYLEKKQCAIIIQQRFRANLLARHHRKIYLQQKSSAIVVQNWFRNVFTTKKQREYYLAARKSVCVLQQRFRKYLAMKKQRQTFIKIKQSVIIIQRYYRSYLLMKICRSSYLQTITAVKIIQTSIRNYLTMKRHREDFLRMREAAIKIQRCFRNYRKKYITCEVNIQAAIKIQSWVRMHAAKKQLILLRKEAQEIKEKNKLKKRHNSAAKIQAMWRGYKTRREGGREITLIRYRSVDAANNAVPELTIAQRNREAIDALINHTTMKTIIRALTLLDFTTRLFPNLCINLCEQITDRLYILLVATNRSAPDMDACVLCVSILISLYKYTPTSATVWQPKYIERLLALLLNWSDKDGLLFPYVCTLIWLFAQNPDYCQVIKNESNVNKILIKTYQHCERKQKMLSNMRNVSTAKVPKEKNLLPSLGPDWGIINKKHPRTFQNSLFAIKCVLKVLNINM